METLTQLSLMNGFALRRGGRTVVVPASCQRLLALLALNAGPMRRSSAAARIWEEASQDRACANLRSALWRIRSSDPALVRTSAVEVELDGGVRVDVRRLAATARRLQDHPCACPSPEVRSLIAAGELLPDWSEPWVVTERERIGQLRLHALERLCEELVKVGRFAEAVDVGLSAVAGEPLRESAHRALIKAYLAEGNRAEAMRQFVRYRDLIRSELGLGPASDVQDLVRDMASRTA